jgi:sugar phosphate permease
VFAGSLVGLAWWAWLGDRTGKRLTLAAAGLAVAGLCVMLIALPLSPTAIVAVLTLGTFFQSSYNAQEFATLQTLYPPQQSGAITGKYNGLTVLLGGVGGSFIPGTLVAYTGSFQAGLLSIAAGAFLVACTLLYLRYRLRRQGRLL